MKEIKLQFFENFDKIKIDEKFIENKESELGEIFGKKYKKFLLKYYERRIDDSKTYKSKFLANKFKIRSSFDIPYKDNESILNNKDYSFVNSISIGEYHEKSYFCIAIGLAETNIEDKIFLINKDNKSQYICNDIDEFIDSICNENDQEIDFYKETSISAQISEYDIENAEKELGLEFPEYFRNFLLETGGGKIEISIPELENYDNEVKLLNKHVPTTSSMYNEDYIYKFFPLYEIIDYWYLLKENEVYNYPFKIISQEYKVIPIGFNGDTGVFYLGSKGSEKENKIYFYDYGCDSSDDGDEPSTFIDYICDSFENYINNYYISIEGFN